MKRIFFVLYLVLFLSSCEDDINSPNYNDNNNLGCPDPTACNFNPFANVNDGTCIYGLSDSAECVAFNDCQLNTDNIWENHTCLDSNGLPFENWNGRESGCGYLYQNAGFIYQDGGYAYQQAVNNGEPCINLTENACDDSCEWNTVSQECELAYVCENAEGSSLDGWSRTSETAEDDCNNGFICINDLGVSLEGWIFSSNDAQATCINTSVCLDSSGNSWPDWDSNSNSAQNDCDEYYQYTPGSCTLEDSQDDSNADDGGTDDGGTDDGGSDG